MIKRSAEQTLHRLARGFPVVCITGPRQSGKTTLAKTAFPDKPYLSLEDPDISFLAREDPRGLLDAYPDGLILDEAQTAPELFKYLKTAVDAKPSAGKYVVTGSNQFDLISTATESLAGRAAFLTLYPFSIRELKESSKLLQDPFRNIVKGFYPPLFDRDVSAYDWHTNYIATYIERDVRSVLNVKDLGQFQTFVKMCAARVGQLLNMSSLAADCGVTHNTAKAWLSVLETSGIAYLLRPYHKNFGKRLVKTPKLYFIDTGLLCRLLGIKDAEQLFVHPNRGSIFECFVVADLLKTRLNAGTASELYFWRDNVGTEIDVVFEEGSRIRAVEIKAGKTFSPDFAAGLEAWRRFSGEGPESCAIVYAGELEPTLKGVSVVRWDSADKLL